MHKFEISIVRDVKRGIGGWNSILRFACIQSNCLLHHQVRIFKMISRISTNLQINCNNNKNIIAYILIPSMIRRLILFSFLTKYLCNRIVSAFMMMFRYIIYYSHYFCSLVNQGLEWCKGELSCCHDKLYTHKLSSFFPFVCQ